MLYYSGYTRRIGGMVSPIACKTEHHILTVDAEVDEGSTVTDFLPAERARGITIQSAAITLRWPPGPPPDEASLTIGKDMPLSSISHEINLIDTPGHADFTFEVMRSLRVLDGAICILDGVAGVEAQTENVWAQAGEYQIPRLIYVNKLDRDGAAFARTTKEIASRLGVWPALCHIPWWSPKDKKFYGIGDVVNLRALQWESGSDGRSVRATSLDELEQLDPTFAEELKKARAALVELLSNHDDALVEEFFEKDENHLSISPSTILRSLRACVLQPNQEIAPVFAGASFRNIGVQPLMDAVLDLLPSPLERPSTKIKIGGSTITLPELLSGRLPAELSQQGKRQKGLASHVESFEGCALAFKVVNDAKRGMLVYVRVYSGSLKQGAVLYNTSLGVVERAQKLLRMYASDAADISSIETGHIGVIVGLKNARTGDTLISYTGVNTKSSPPAPFNSLELRPIRVPPPVFFTSIEPESQSEEKSTHEALQTLLREDPSLSVSIDDESGQTLLAGMGELHLEIARDRLIKDLKARARTGRIEIGYREAITTSSVACKATVDREIAGKHSWAKCIASVEPLKGDKAGIIETTQHELGWSLPDGNELVVRFQSPDNAHPQTDPDGALPSHLPLVSVMRSLEAGATAALAKGPVHAFPLHSTRVVIHLNPKEHVSSDTSLSAITLASRQAVQAAIRSACQGKTSALMEPVMLAKISVNEQDLGPVIQDLSSARGGQILSLGDDDAATSSISGFEAAAQDEHHLDAKNVYTPRDPFASGADIEVAVSMHRTRQITARVPLREMIGYLKHLRSLTGGRGTFTMQVNRFEPVNGPRLKRALEEIRGCV
jgi:elongation factor G